MFEALNGKHVQNARKAARAPRRPVIPALRLVAAPLEEVLSD